nr:TonB-dependent receptor plug domain-containing protein [Neisseria sp. 51.81]
MIRMVKLIAFALMAVLPFCDRLSAAPLPQGRAARLPEVVVYGRPTVSLSSVKTVGQGEIGRLAGENGNVSDYLRSHPNIRYEESDRDGFRQGEIRPEAVLINGAPSDQTAYLVDNVNVNNDLTVDGELFDGSVQVVPGISHRQGYFFDANLLSGVAVHDKNISAALGGFGGGAVVAKTKRYGGRDRWDMRYRTTRSAWTEFYADAAAASLLKRAVPVGSEAVFQPEFRKQTFGIGVEKGWGDVGLAAGFSRRTSDIAQHRITGSNGRSDRQKHTRRSDNALVNLDWAAADRHRIELGLRYSDYREGKFYAGNLDNNVTDSQTAYGATLASIYTSDSGVLTHTLAYDVFRNGRRSNAATAEIVNVLNEDDDSVWDYEKGGYGNSRLKQKNIHYSFDYAPNPFRTGSWEHAVSLGGLYQHTDYAFRRDQDVYSLYRSEYLDGSPTWEMPKQLFARQGSVKTHYGNAALYLEDLIRAGKWEWRPGLRLERDDYLKNTNIAPRFTVRYSPFEQTRLTFGRNRYYGRSFSALKLSDEILKLNGSPDERYGGLGRLNSPYTDETTFGVAQAVGGWRVAANYIRRQNRQSIGLVKEQVGEKPNGDPLLRQYYRNRPSYGSRIYTLEIRRTEPWRWGMAEWSVGLALDWLDMQNIRAADADTPVYLDGKLTTKGRMAAKANSGRENWTARLALDMALPAYGLTWTNRLYAKAPVRQYEKRPDGINRLDAYDSYDYGRHMQWDSSLRWQPALSGGHRPYIKLDLVNVLNRKRQIRTYRAGAGEYGIYTPGRQFWLELGYAF